MNIPLHLRIKKESHKKIAYAQDLIVEELYQFFPRAVFHGGTAIWRCYEGNRFSEDIDVYLPTKENIDEFFDKLLHKGFTVLKKRLKDNSLYSLLSFDRTNVRFEAVFKKVNGILKDYETASGTIITVYTLSADQLLDEKIAACMKRGKVRDLYDIFFLLKYVKPPKNLGMIAHANIVDEDNLQTIILTGLVPTVKDMKNYIAAWGL